MDDVDVVANIEKKREKVKSANERRPWGPTLANGARRKMVSGAERWKRTGRVYTPPPSSNVPAKELAYEDQPKPLPAQPCSGTTSGSIATVSTVSGTEKGASMGSSFTTAGLIKPLSQIIMAVITTAYSLKEIVSNNSFGHFNKINIINVWICVVPGVIKTLAFVIGPHFEAAGD